MKTLQNNFTTPEQSKRLLELGVPADSADCYHGKDNKIHIFDGSIPKKLAYVVNCVPCWSVGRLIEIIFVCWYGQQEMKLTRQYHGIDAIVESIERYIGYLDFSKLEE